MSDNNNFLRELGGGVAGLFAGRLLSSSALNSLGSSIDEVTGPLTKSDERLLRGILNKETADKVKFQKQPRIGNLFSPGSRPPHINLDPSRTSVSVGLHEIGHAMDTKSRLASILRSNKARIGGGVLSSMSVVPAAILGSQIVDDNVSANTALATAGMAGLGSLPIIAEEIRATRNANRLARKYRLGKLKGLKRALGTYGIAAIAPALAGLGFGLGSRMMGK